MSHVNQALTHLKNPTVEMYLDLMHGTESPPIFHVWSLISAASACMTRRCWFDMGPIRIMPNQFIMLVGAPGVRKSTSVSFGKRLLSEIPHLRFAPNSTGGHMQGLIAAMVRGQSKQEDDDDDAIGQAVEAINSLNFGQDSDESEDALGATHTLNRSALYVAEGELTTFLGLKRDDFINFLGDMWDKAGEAEHVYQLKREKIRIGNPCLNMIGGITPMHITTYLPPQSIGQGFTSRVLMVYSDYRKKIPWPEPLNDKAFGQFKRLMNWIFESKEGPFDYTEQAKELIEELYYYKVEIEDARFIHYTERRQTHMIKVAMALCALRMDNVITAEDVRDAHNLLAITETTMAEALGDYGLSPLALAKARVSDILRNAQQPMSAQRILIAAGSDINRADVGKALHELSQTKQIIELVLADSNGIERSGYVWPMESNPFAPNERVKVDYLLADRDTTNRAKGSTAAARLADKLDEHEPGLENHEHRGPEWDKLEAAQPRERVTSPHTSHEPSAPTLATAGHMSVMDKVAALINRKREKSNE